MVGVCGGVVWCGGEDAVCCGSQGHTTPGLLLLLLSSACVAATHARHTNTHIHTRTFGVVRISA